MKDFPLEMTHGSGVRVLLDDTRLLVDFTQPAKEDEVAVLVRGLGFELEQSAGTIAGPERTTAEIINHTPNRFWIRTQRGESVSQELYERFRQSLGARVGWIGPVYRPPNMRDRGGHVCPLPNVLVIRSPGEPGAADPLRQIIEKYALNEDQARSKYLPGFRVFLIDDPSRANAYQLKDAIGRDFPQAGRDLTFENMPMVRDQTLVPNDTLYAQQWGMARIDAGGAGNTGWNLSTGSGAVVVAVIDYGFDLTHPDLTYVAGVKLDDMSALTAANSGTDPHGTACAGIIAARFNNALGVAGLAGNCGLMPVRRVSGSDVETAAGISWAATNGADVISMSFRRYAMGEGFGPTGWNFALIDPAIADAVNVRGAVLCAATGNEDTGTVNGYPARHPLVIGCGASDQIDGRKSPASPDAETWGSNFGTNVYLGVTTGVSVVAPGVLIPTTDAQGAAGYNAAAGVAGDYVVDFNGTSSATPHVAGLAGLVRSLYPTLTNVQVRNIIERTAEKVGVVAYAEVAGFNNGTRNQEMGYGRINALRALDYSDIMIRDWSGDTGIEPSNPPGGDFWDFSDIAVRASDDGIFHPSIPSDANRVERGQTNYVYVQVTNNGPQTARNVSVSVRVTPWVGTQFVYPSDWTLVDANHVSPTGVTSSFATLAAGASAMATFTLSSAQVDMLWGWEDGMGWHPCLLASASADNDYAFLTASFTTPPVPLRRNNLAQRNLTVVNDVAGADSAFPILTGHRLNRERVMELVIDRRELPAQHEVHLVLDGDRRLFPSRVFDELAVDPRAVKRIDFLERTRMRTNFGCCDGILTLEKGSTFECAEPLRLTKVRVEGGDLIEREGRRLVRLTSPVVIVRAEKEPGAVYPLTIETKVPLGSAANRPVLIRVTQRNEKGVAVGGASVAYVARKQS